VHALRWPGRRITVAGVGNKVLSARVGVELNRVLVKNAWLVWNPWNNLNLVRGTMNQETLLRVLRSACSTTLCTVALWQSSQGKTSYWRFPGELSRLAQCALRLDQLA